MDLVRELLDIQVRDRHFRKVGRVDGIVVELREGKPPRVERLELGFVVLARRIGRRVEKVAEHWHKRLDVRRSARYHIRWSEVIEVKMHHLKVNVPAEESVAFDWERWARRIVERMPGGKQEEDQKT